MKKLLTLAFSLVFASAALAAEFPDISITDLNKAISEKKVTVIDVNGSQSYKAGHVPSAIDFASTQDLSSVLPKEKDALIVAYCGGPSCNAYQKAAKKAAELGYTNVKHLSAGISGWKKEGQPLEK